MEIRTQKVEPVATKNYFQILSSNQGNVNLCITEHKNCSRPVTRVTLYSAFLNKSLYSSYLTPSLPLYVECTRRKIIWLFRSQVFRARGTVLKEPYFLMELHLRSFVYTWFIWEDSELWGDAVNGMRLSGTLERKKYTVHIGTMKTREQRVDCGN